MLKGLWLTVSTGIVNGYSIQFHHYAACIMYEVSPRNIIINSSLLCLLSDEIAKPFTVGST